MWAAPGRRATARTRRSCGPRRPGRRAGRPAPRPGPGPIRWRRTAAGRAAPGRAPAARRRPERGPCPRSSRPAARARCGHAPRHWSPARRPAARRCPRRSACTPPAPTAQTAGPDPRSWPTRATAASWCLPDSSPHQHPAQKYRHKRDYRLRLDRPWRPCPAGFGCADAGGTPKVPASRPRRTNACPERTPAPHGRPAARDVRAASAAVAARPRRTCPGRGSGCPTGRPAG